MAGKAILAPEEPPPPEKFTDSGYIKNENAFLTGLDHRLECLVSRQMVLTLEFFDHDQETGTQ